MSAMTVARLSDMAQLNTAGLVGATVPPGLVIVVIAAGLVATIVELIDHINADHLPTATSTAERDGRT